MWIANHIDNTLLRPNVSDREVEAFLRASVEAGFYAVCLNPVWIPFAKKVVGNGIRLCSVVGFPLGETTKEIKLHEASYLLEQGADEIDVVMRISAFKSGRYGEVLEELLSLRRCSEGKVMKVIVETAYLSQEEKSRALELCLDSGADFIKTSTGFAPQGARLEDVKLFKELSRGRIRVKAAGGIRDYETVVSFLRAGADRIGTSSGLDIVRNF